MSFQLVKIVSVMLLVSLMSSCINEKNPSHISLGNVTLGQQLIDLKRALEDEALDEDEYNRIKAGLIDASTLCSNTAIDEDEDDDSWFF